MNNKSILLSLLFLLSFTTFSQSQNFGYRFKKDKNKVVIPFEVYNNLIIVQVRMNGLPMKFILDTGVHNTILVQKSYADILNVDYDRTISLLGADRSQVMTAHVASGINMELDNIINTSEMMLVLEEDYLDFEKIFGTDVHGIIGFEMFRRFVIKINYIYNTITLYQPESFRKPRGARYTSHHISIEKAKPYMEFDLTLENQDTVHGKFLLDTGASFDILVDINSSDKLAFPEKTIVGDMGRGLGGLLEGKIGRLHQINFEPFQFNDLTTFYQNDTLFNQFFKDKSRTGIIGGGVLSRFQVIFDYSNNLVYFKKNKNYKKPFKFNMTGIILAEGEDKAIMHSIKSVLPNSPASEADILPGDKILRINNYWGPELTRSFVKTIFKSKEGEKLKIWIVRENQIVTKTIVLKSLI